MLMDSTQDNSTNQSTHQLFSPETSERSNIALDLITCAQHTPEAPAVICSRGVKYPLHTRYITQTYKELNQSSAQCALGLKRLLEPLGITKGDRVLVMVRPGPELFTLTFGLFKAGLVPVLIDPGMDKKALKSCINHASPSVFVGIGIAHWARRLLGWGRHSIRCTIGVGFGCMTRLTLNRILQAGQDAKDEYIAATHPTDDAAILFTSGSTGTPKGAQYQHRHFMAQVDLLKQTYTFEKGTFDVPTFPLFALFDPALGMSAVFPKMDFSAPAKANPEELFTVIDDFKAGHLFCSPALLRKVAQALPLPSSSSPFTPRLPTLKRVISAGAPVPPVEMSRFKAHLHPQGEIYTPYGATESLPICSISCSEVLEHGEKGEKQGFGVCVGKVVDGVSVKVIPITDDPLESWDLPLLNQDHSALSPLYPSSSPETQSRRIGELVVYGPSTTQGYFKRPQGNQLSKIQGAPPHVPPLPYQTLSHRMGDLGYIDEQGYVWLCGRKSHRVEWQERTYFPLCVEGIFNHCPFIQRSALSYNQQGPVLWVILDPQSTQGQEWSSIEKELLNWANTSPITEGITQFYTLKSFPVDTRHNAKIKREILTQWAHNRALPS